MNIGSAAKLSGLTVKSVRYYADIDLVKPVINEKNGYRDYNNNDIAKLGFIGQARKFNFSIRECRDLLSLYEDKNRSNKEVKKLTIEKINDVIKLFTIEREVVVCFDGVAPISKLKQQRERRFKTWIRNEVCNKNDKKSWNTCSITPGTKFMKKFLILLI